AIKNKAWKIHTRQRHAGGGDRFVTANHADYRVEELATTDELDGIRDDLAADQRGAHALGAHGLAVGDGDGIELHGSAARGANALFHLSREAAQVKVAGHGFNPGVGHADERLGEVGIRIADRLEHGARTSAVRAVGNDMTAMFEVHRCGWNYATRG